MKKLILCLLLFPLGLKAQMVLEATNNIPVYRANESLIANPWTGGVNAVEISVFDADGDGVQDDIFLFDKAGNRVLVFTGSMESGERVYAYRPDLAAHFPTLTDWALLRDFNCDGKKDIFTYSTNIGGSFMVFENVSTENNLDFEPETTSIQTLYQFQNNSFSNQIYVSSQDIPAIFDFDDDGDLDILTFSVSGSFVELHLNTGLENDGECSVNSYRLANRCYGRFAEGSESNNIITDPDVLAGICDFNVVNPKSNSTESSKDNRHVGSTILTFDANQDGLKEIVLGDVTYTNMTYLRMNDYDGVEVDGVDFISPTFPSTFGAAQVNIDNFPAGFYEDINGDGIKDLIVSVNSPYLSANLNSVWYYENTGLTDLPDFNLVQTDFIQDETIDFGEASSPAFFDYNNDGLLDFAVGSRGVYQGLGVFNSTLSLFVNTGTASSPEYVLEDANWLDVNGLGLGQYVDPAFGDIDGDGDDDLILGDASGGLFLFENTTGSNNPNYSLAGAITADGENLDVGQNSSPEIFDLDQDGLLDLIIGERNGNLNYYRNTGTATSPQFTFVNDTLGGISTVEFGFFVGNSSPAFFELDGTLFLTVGGEAGKLHLYENIEDNLEGDFDLISNTAFGVNSGWLSKPAVADINNDNLPDVLCGSVGGGVLAYLATGVVSVGQNASAPSLRIYPNPARDAFNIEGVENASYIIYAIDGSRVAAGNYNSSPISVSNLPAGLYIVEVNMGGIPIREKLLKP